ncbi:MAG: LytTR family transcriptional regulator, partial [Saprospiraceae bacterium]|nr:LytTR family transcriptional regulator [Saprospiraceae bacterium]
MNSNLNHAPWLPPVHRIALPIKNGFAFYDLHGILYFKSAGNYAYMKLAGHLEELFISHPLAKLENELNKVFIRPHNQYLVNINHIEQMIRTSERVELLLTGGIKIPIARNRKG